MQKSHRQQHQIRIHAELAARNFRHLKPSVVPLRPVDPDGVQLGNLPALSAQRLGQYVVVANSALLVSAGSTQHHRPLRPGVVIAAFRRRLRQQLKLADDFGALPVRRPQAVGPGVAAPQNDHPLALRRNLVGNAFARQFAVLLRQVFHRQMHARQFPTRHLQVPGVRRTAGKANGVILRQQPLRRIVNAHIDAGAKNDAFGFHQRYPPAHYRLFQLEIGNAQHQQAADVVGPFQHRYAMPGAVQLLGGGQARRPAAHYGHRLAAAPRRRHRPDPALLIPPIADFLLNVFNRNRVRVDAQHARRFARRRADAPREFREIVRA